MLQFFFEGDDFLASLRAALNEARYSIDLELYYFASDNVGWDFVELLKQKASAGVKIRIIYDAIGCRGTSNQLFAELQKHKIHVKVYNPFLPLSGRSWGRDHRKFMIIDEAVCFLGGFNVAKEYSQSSTGATAWRDTAVRIADLRLAEQMSLLFAENWEGRLHLRDALQAGPKRLDWSSVKFHLVPYYGWYRKNPIRREYVAAIVQAHNSIYITNPYFVPDRRFRRALKQARRRGVDVRVLVPSAMTDVPAVRWASHSTFANFLNVGVRIYEYQPRFVHAKCAVIDDEWFTVGTFNFDHFSLFRNLEVNLFGRDQQYARSLSAQFLKDIESAKEITLDVWKQRPWWHRWREKIFYLLRRWL